MIIKSKWRRLRKFILFIFSVWFFVAVSLYVREYEGAGSFFLFILHVLSLIFMFLSGLDFGFYMVRSVWYDNKK